MKIDEAIHAEIESQDTPYDIGKYFLLSIIFSNTGL